MGIWMNQRTGENEQIDGFPPDERLSEFLSQNAIVQNLFYIRIKMGTEPIKAFEETLLDSIPEKYRANEEPNKNAQAIRTQHHLPRHQWPVLPRRGQ